MRTNRGPEKLIEQMKSLSGNSDGFQITGSLTDCNTSLLMAFMPFKKFIDEQARAVKLSVSGDFYFNFLDAGFTGIACFNGSHVSIHTYPSTAKAIFEVFLSDRLLDNIHISEAIYRSTVEFFTAKVESEVYQSL